MLGAAALFSSDMPNAQAQSGSAQSVHVLSVDGAISPAYADYIKDGIGNAHAQGAELVLIELNTPGGLLTSTRSIVSTILGSPVPVVVYVTPSGAHAASAGTFILMAGHIAAMDTGTNVGAATPVEIGGPLSGGSEKEEEQSGNSNDRALAEKAKQNTTAFIRSIAEMRGRNVEWAERAVMEANSITEQEALEKNVIDLVAASRSELLAKIHMRPVTMKDGDVQAINTENIRAIENSPKAMTRFLAFISDPNVATILMMIGVYGLLLEFYAPGSMIPGTIGAICLMLALYAFSILPVSGLGATLLVIGLLFMVAEIFIPSFGIMGFGGIIAIVIGLAVFFDQSAMPGLALEWQVILGVALSAGLFLGVAFLLFVKSRLDQENMTGPESMIGQTARVIAWGDINQGHVFIDGERWKAFAPPEEGPFTPDEKVLVSAVDGLRLKIRKMG